MKLYFLRHATASDNAATDAERELTSEGKQEARVLAAALEKLGAIPAHIFSSPLIRACQTAQIVAKVMEFAHEVEVLEQLKNDTTTAALIRVLKSYPQDQDLFLTGHEPSLSEHIAALIGAEKAEGIPLGKGGAACVELPVLRSGFGQLQWLLRQKQLRLLAR